MEYTTDKTKTTTVNDFKGLLEKALNEQKKTADYVIENQIKIGDDELNDDVIRNSMKRFESFIEEGYDKVVEQANELKISENELREVRGVLGGGINRQQGIADEQRIALQEIEKKTLERSC